MAFNFNISDMTNILQQFNQFKSFLNSSGKNPTQLLEEELKRRNVKGEDFTKLMQAADALKNILGTRL